MDEATLEKLAKVKEAFDRQDPITRKAQQKTRLVLLLGSLLVLATIGFIYYLSSHDLEAPFDPNAFNPMDPSAPADSRTGDPFEKARKRLQEAMPKVSAGNPEGLKELQSLVHDAPQSPQAAKALAVLASTYRFQKQNHTEAIKAYSQLLEDFPDHRDTDRTRKYFIEYLIELGRTKEARQQAEILKEEAKSPRDKTIAEAFLKQLQ